ncbi:DUF3304 domain-containing protein, partial [Pseudomonas aeruginosa]|nr:DUF3304 domain-containing protein [Pseudomonas aeruginosa]
ATNEAIPRAPESAPAVTPATIESPQGIKKPGRTRGGRGSTGCCVQSPERWQRDAKGGVGFQRLPHPLTGWRQAFLTEFRAHVHALRVDEGDVV